MRITRATPDDLDTLVAYLRSVVLPHNPSGALFQRPAQRVSTPHLQEVESLTG